MNAKPEMSDCGELILHCFNLWWTLTTRNKTPLIAGKLKLIAMLISSHTL
jgi:hypothetical protein